jgi:hypothetical protein
MSAPVSLSPMIDQLQLNSELQQPKTDADLAGTFGKALSDARGLEKQATEAAEKFANGDPNMGSTKSSSLPRKPTSQFATRRR